MCYDRYSSDNPEKCVCGCVCVCVCVCVGEGRGVGGDLNLRQLINVKQTLRTIINNLLRFQALTCTTSGDGLNLA